MVHQEISDNQRPKKRDNMEHVIIGNSAAGVFAAEAIRDRDGDCTITIISDEDSPCYSRCLLPYYISGELLREELLIRGSEWYKERAIRTLVGKRAVRIAEQEKVVILDDGKHIPYDDLLVATGSSIRFPEIEGTDDPMVFGLRTMDDALRISEVLPGVKRAVVLGGGLIGLKAAYALWKREVKVTVVEMLGQILPRMLDLPAAGMIEKSLEEKNILVRTGTRATEITGRGNRVESVGLDNGETIECDLVICAVGVKPNIEVVGDTGIETKEGILVDDHMRTNVPGVYAAGDVAETIDFLSGERGVNAIWPSAAKEGKVAGCNMAGVAKRCDVELSMNSVDLLGTPIVSIGLIDPQGEEYEVMTASVPEGNVYRKLVLSDGRIVGMLFVGDIEKAGVILSLIRREDDVSAAKSAFLEGKMFKRSRVTRAFGKTLRYPVTGQRHIPSL